MLRQQDAHVRIAFDEHARSAGAAEHPMCTAGPSAHASGRRAAVPSHHAAPGHNAAGAVSARNASAAGRECAIGDATCAVSYLLSVSPPPRHTWSASPLASAEAGPCAPGAEYGTKQRGSTYVHRCLHRNVCKSYPAAAPLSPAPSCVRPTPVPPSHRSRSRCHLYGALLQVR